MDRGVSGSMCSTVIMMCAAAPHINRSISVPLRIPWLGRHQNGAEGLRVP